MDTAIAPALPDVELRYPEGSSTIWTAIRPGYYALLVEFAWALQDNSPPTIMLYRVASSDEICDLKFADETEKSKITGVCASSSPMTTCALLGPYDTPQEARRALKLYGIMLALGPYPHAVFEEPDGTTIPLGRWVNLPD